MSDLDKLIAEADRPVRGRKCHQSPRAGARSGPYECQVAAAELTRDRLRAALPRLRARYTQARHQEDVTAWKAEAEQLAVRRDELRMEFMRICRPN